MKCLRVFPRLHRSLPAVLLAVALVASCAGEAFVTYRGSVFTDAAGAVSFDLVRNPAGAPPVAGALVRLSVCTETCTGNEPAIEAVTDDEGAWGPIDRSFGGLAGTSHVIRIEISAPGHRPHVYAAVYEETGDPRDGEAYLNVGLQPGE